MDGDDDDVDVNVDCDRYKEYASDYWDDDGNYGLFCLNLWDFKSRFEKTQGSPPMLLTCE